MKFILCVTAIAAVLAATGCSSMSNKPDIKNVEVTRETPKGDCRSLGKIEGRTNNAKGNTDDALKDLQQEAANKGASHVVVEQYSASGLSVTGVAYRCD